MFQALIGPSSGVCDCVVELPHWLISFLVCSVLEWYPSCWLKPAARIPPWPNRTLTPAHSKPRTKSANAVVQQHSRKLLKMVILMPETCWVSKKKNKNNKWHLVGFLFFSYHKMHGPINTRLFGYINCLFWHRSVFLKRHLLSKNVPLLMWRKVFYMWPGDRQELNRYFLYQF